MVPAGQPSSSAAGPSTKKPKLFEIKKWNAVALWAWGTTSWISVSSAKLNQASATSEECTVACEFIEAVEAKSSSSSGYGSMTMEASLEGQSYLDVPASQMVHEQLWVDKYAPKSFTELLSDEQTNRERHSSVAQTQRPFNSKFSRTNRGAKWSSGRYKNSRSMDESSNSQGIEDILNTRTTNVGPPEQKAQPVNVPTSFKQRAILVDEIWHAAGTYSTTEIYMLTDTSPDFHDTWAFLDARVKNAFDLKKTIQEFIACGSGMALNTADMALNAITPKTLCRHAYDPRKDDECHKGTIESKATKKEKERRTKGETSKQASEKKKKDKHDKK
ncbi:Ubiquinone biosynthesis protein [Arachis hypogaea]|nr:Ubiquinone biosynthesis protein [Arachis hypogaea]